MRRSIKVAAAAVVAILAALIVLPGAARAAAVTGYPSWPGKNGKIVIEMYPPGQFNNESAWTLNPDGSNLKQIFVDPSQYGNAFDMSPSGNLILSSTRLDCSHDTLTSVTVNPPALTNNPFQWLDSVATGSPTCPSVDLDAAYSYDGSKVAFVRDGADGTAGLWVMRADGSNKRRIYVASGISDIRWSPFNYFISFSIGGQTYRTLDSTPPGDPISPNFYPPQPGRPSPFDPATGNSPPVLSPDKTKIVYLHCCYADTGSVAQVVVANADGSNPQRITTINSETFCGPAGCPDSTFAGDVSQVMWQSIPDTPTLQQIRSELQAMGTAAPLTFWARFWLNRAIESMGWADGPGCWTSDVQVVNTEAGYTCLQALRITMLRLYYANSELRGATEPQRKELIALLGRVVHERFKSVDAAQPLDEYLWRASGQTEPLWAARQGMDAGDGETTNFLPAATIPYLRSWHRMINLASVTVPS